ncbi:MAG TPA: hypothetical protein VG820_12100, partial [Fimbriimonadaceae bacterium]|nr:hypothetical protein [Fimbriimonadaceae bacterium]
MRTTLRALIGSATVSLCIGSAHAQDVLKQWGISYGGYLDAYYQYDFGHPQDGDNVNGRGIDIAHNRPNLAFAELDLSRATSAKSPFGFTLDLYV